MKQLQKKIKAGTLDVKDDPFELFISATNIRYCYYSETHKILGNTYGMCVLQVCVHACVCVTVCGCGCVFAPFFLFVIEIQSCP